MTPEQFLAKCEAAFAADEPQVIPASVARAMCEMANHLGMVVKHYSNASAIDRSVYAAFTAACKEIEA